MTTVFHSLLPADRLRSLATGENLDGWSAGSALFADISGFTTLAEALMAELGDARGAERLSESLNLAFEALIGPVDRHGGSVVALGGDAVLCWFAGDDGARAASAAHHMHATLATLTERFGRRPLLIRVGISAGRACRITLGDAPPIDALVGEPAEQAIAAQQRAGIGQTLLGESRLAESLLGEMAYGEATSERSLSVPSPPSPPAQGALTGAAVDALMRWVPSYLVAPLRASVPLVGELRSVVSLFVRFPVGTTSVEAIDGYVRWSQQVVAEQHGVVLSVMPGDKGGYLLASFGAPIGIDAPASAAVAAALRFAQGDGGKHAPTGVGVSVGRLYAGFYGADVRRTWGLIGDAVNLGARLMSHATDGEVVVTAEVRESAGWSHAFKDRGQIVVKGRLSEVPIFEATGSNPHSGARPRRSTVTPRTAGLTVGPSVRALVGRQDALDALSAALGRLEGGQGGTIIVDGEAGMGKSALVATLLGRASARGVRTVFGGADPVRNTSPLHVFRPVLEALFGLHDAPEAADARRRHVEAQLPGDARSQQLAPLIEAVLPLGWTDTPLTAQLSSEVRASNTLELLSAVLLSRLGSDPCVLVLEDAHWADSASRALIRACARLPLPLLLVLTTRPPDSDAQAGDAWSADLPDAHRLHLGPLPPDAVGELIRVYLGVRSVPAEVLAVAAQRCGGHPLFIEEWVQSLMEAGILRRFEDVCVLAAGPEALATFAIGETVEALIGGRIDRLSPGAQTALKVASVVGPRFAASIVAAVGGAPPEQTEAYFHELADHGLIVRSGHVSHGPPGSPADTWEFKHALVKDATYARLLFAQRRVLHCAAAEQLERASADAASSPLLAHHWVAAEQPERALPFLDAATEFALEAGAYLEAVGFVRQALAADPDGARSAPTAEEARDRSAQRIRRLGQGLFGLGRIVEATACLERAVALWWRPIPAAAPAVAWGLGREAIAQYVHRRRPARFMGTSTRPLAAVRAAQTAAELVPCYFIANQLPRMMYVTLLGLNLAEAAAQLPDARRLAVEIYASMALVGSGIRQPRMADFYRLEGLSQARTIGHLPTLARVLQVTSLCTLGAGQLADTDAAVTEAIEHYRHLGDHRREEESLGIQAWLSVYQARFDRGQALWGSVYRGAIQRGDRQSQALALVGRTGHLLRLDFQAHAAEAWALLDEAAPLLPDNDDPIFLAHHSAHVGRLAWARGDVESARSHATRALMLLQKATALASYGMEVYGLTADLLLDLYARAPSSATAKQVAAACALLTKYARTFPIGVPRALRCAGLSDTLTGKTARGLARITRAASEADRLQMSYEALEARRHLRLLAEGRPSSEGGNHG